MIDGEALARLRYGSVLDAYGTQLFGQSVTRSEKGKALSDELAALNTKSLFVSLSAEENLRREHLITTLGDQFGEKQA
jgi:hypothetical protein